MCGGVVRWESDHRQIQRFDPVRRQGGPGIPGPPSLCAVLQCVPQNRHPGRWLTLLANGDSLFVVRRVTWRMCDRVSRTTRYNPEEVSMSPSGPRAHPQRLDGKCFRSVLVAQIDAVQEGPEHFDEQ